MPALPDITPAQLAAWLATVIGAVVVLFDLNMTDAQRGALVTILVAAATIFHFVSDSIIRHGRATGVGAEMVRQLPRISAPSVEADGDDTKVAEAPKLPPASPKR